MKHIFLTLLIFTIVILKSQVPTNSLLAFYPFNGNANDASGNAQHGTVYGATLTTDRFGNANSAYSFNGSSNYISLPAGTFTNLNIYTYSCWIKASVANNGFAMCFGESSYGYCQGLLTQPAGSITATSYNNGSSPIQSLIHSSSTFSLNQWLHIAMTRDFTTIKLYVNGVLYSSSTAGTGNQNASYGTNLPIRALIGVRSLFNSGTYFGGIIDDVRIYGTVLSQSEIGLLYTEGCFQNMSVLTHTTCSNLSDTIVANATSTNSISWYSSPTSTSSIANGSVLVTPVLSTGQYTYYAQASNCASIGQRLPIQIVVYPTPTITVASGTICSGNSFSISPSGAFNYSYSTTNPVSPVNTSTYTVVGSSSLGCLSGITTVTVDVTTTPTINVNSGFICNGQSFTLSPTGASSYTFSGGSAIVSPTTNTTYTITGSNGNGCYASAFSNVGVVANPTLSISNPGNVCIGNSLNLGVSGANYYTWSTGSNSTNITVSPTVNTSYTVSGVNLFGCLSTSVANVNVNPLPLITVGNATICAGNNYTLNPSGAATYSYSNGSAVVSPSVNTNYSITGTSAFGCVSSNTAVASIAVIASPTISVNNGTLCSGESFTLNPSGGLTYTISGGNTIVSPLSSTNYTIIGSGANGCTGSAIAYLTVNNLPLVSISSPGTVCSGSSVNLIANGASSYTWNTSATSSSISVSPGITTTYSVIGQDANGCRNNASQTISVNPLPFITVNSGSICSGNSFTIIASGASTYTYSGGSNIVSPTNTTTYSVTGTSAFGCLSSNTAIATVNVLSTPTITVNSGSICAGTSFTMNPSGAVSYSYSGGNSIVSPLSNTQYTVYGFGSNGCNSTAISTVTVISLPSISISGPSSVCNGNSIVLTASGANTYTWNTGPSSNSILVNPTTTSIYSVVGVSSNNCSNTATTQITVNSLPVISVNSGSICSGSVFTMSPTGASTYTFSTGSNTVAPSGNSSYSVIGTSAQGCVSSNTAVSTISVVNLPTVTALSGSICSGATFTIQASGANSYTYSSGSALVSPSASTTYSVIGSNIQGCVSLPSLVSVTVQSSPSISVNSGSICNGSSFTINPTGANSYTISGGNFVVSPNISTSYFILGTSTAGCVSSTVISNVTVYNLPLISVNSGSICSGNSFILSPTGAVTYSYSGGTNTVSPTTNATYSVVGFSSQGCASSNTAISNVSVVTSPTISASGGTICAGDNFIISPSGASSYTISANSLTVSPANTTTYSVIGSDINGCISANTVTLLVQVNPLPTLSIISTNSVCSGNSATLSASGAFTYTWNNSSIGFSIAVTPSITSGFTVHGTDINGCVGIDSAYIYVFNAPASVQVSNASICPGNSFTLAPSGAASYSYSNGSAIVSPSSTTSYSVYGISVEGCISPTPAIAIISVVNSLTVSISGNNTVCLGDSTLLQANGAGTYSWSNGASSNAIYVQPSATSTYSVLGTGGSCTNSAVHTISVNPLPTITVNSGTICSGSVFTIVPNGAISYTYSGGTNIVSPLTSTVYLVSGSNSDGCQSIAQASVYTNPLPIISFDAAAIQKTICQGESATIVASGAQTYTWSPGTFANTNSISASPSITTIYSVTGEDFNTCKSQQTIEIVVETCLGMDGSISKENSIIKMYPNPNNGQFFMEINFNSNEAVFIYFEDIQGKLIKSIEVTSSEKPFELTNLNLVNGLYLCRIYSGNILKSTQKLIITD